MFLFTVRRLLIKGVSPSATNEDGLTALHQVIFFSANVLKMKTLFCGILILSDFSKSKKDLA